MLLLHWINVLKGYHVACFLIGSRDAVKFVTDNC